MTSAPPSNGKVDVNVTVTYVGEDGLKQDLICVKGTCGTGERGAFNFSSVRDIQHMFSGCVVAATQYGPTTTRMEGGVIDDAGGEVFLTITVVDPKRSLEINEPKEPA